MMSEYPSLALQVATVGKTFLIYTQIAQSGDVGLEPQFCFRQPKDIFPLSHCVITPVTQKLLLKGDGMFPAISHKEGIICHFLPPAQT